ncbi:MAG: RpiB/LacA/LacB family sugar-phosphate isomerase [Spirochaetaceae bacterium]|nr:RpiB/LacA/LacB family sugar-phosphate isomerase [Spirochaetaceae bacterium]MCF7947601.1 RpiB/LacA/LacB family sugar-phosphate isomerase [Spirochaetia bacterium]MCF7951469.1 RpiB/LacA/LacB family sugar-phosphate isomerase [Spirochaetaceae bacterium]
MKTVALGCDPNAAWLKKEIIAELEELGYEYQDYGSEDPIYANVAIEVAEAVAAGTQDLGIVVCGTGIGVSIAANKVPGAYCAVVNNAYQAERAVKSNNTNMMAMGAQVVGDKLARTLVRIWLAAEWVPGGRSEPKMQRIYDYEKKHSG